jgi:flagellar hook-length control protein FliK
LQYADGIGWSVSPQEPGPASGATTATPGDPSKNPTTQTAASIPVTRTNGTLSRQSADPSAEDLAKSVEPFAETTLDNANEPTSDPAITTNKAPDRRPSEHTSTQHATTHAAEPLPQPAPNAQANTASTPSPSADNISIPPATNASTTAESSGDTPVRLAVATREGQTAEMQTLALHIAARSAKGDSRFTIRLDPPELGQIDVNLSVNSHGHAQAVLAVEKPQTLDLLLRDAPALERALKDAGLELGSNLSFSLKDEGRQNFAREDQYSPQARTVELVPTDSAGPHPALNTSLVEQLYGLRTARLDIRV